MTPGEHHDKAEEWLEASSHAYQPQDKTVMLLRALVHGVLATSKFGTPASPILSVVQEVPDAPEVGSEPA